MSGEQQAEGREAGRRRRGRGKEEETVAQHDERWTPFVVRLSCGAWCNVEAFMKTKVISWAALPHSAGCQVDTTTHPDVIT